MNSRQAFTLKHFREILFRYNGQVPFHQFFRTYCQNNKSLGSRDRKVLREMIYAVFRSGAAWKNVPADALFFWPMQCRPDSLDLSGLYEGLTPHGPAFHINFPFEDQLDEGVNREDFYRALQTQPALWIRVADEQAAQFAKSMEGQIEFTEKSCPEFVSFGLKNGTSLDTVNVSYVVQDLSSQLVASKIEWKPGEVVWDCCCGAGGKSLFLSARYPGIKLMASDIRSSVLDNLRKRYQELHLKLPFTSTLDLGAAPPDKENWPSGKFPDLVDVLVADVPCSGSGTWAREPEHIAFFEKSAIDRFAELQYRIVHHALQRLKTGGILYYITCSVFQKENSGVADRLIEKDGLHLQWKSMVNGWDKKADGLFIACLKKP